MAAPLSKKVLFLLAVLVTAAGAAAYHNAPGNGATNFDDHWQVTENPLVSSPSFENARLVLTRSYHGLYLPVKLLSYMADHALYGAVGVDVVFGVHLTNVVLHIANSILVGVICMLAVWDLAARRITAEGAVFVGVFAGVLFAVHPVHVESVAWLSSRKDVLSFFFMALSLLAFRRAVTAGGALRGAASVLFFALALGSKTTVVCLPLVATAYWWLLSRPGGRRAVGLLGVLYALALGAVALAGSVVSRAGYGGEPVGGSYLLHWLTMIKTFPFYMRVLMFPVNLNVIYSLPRASWLFDPGVLRGIAMGLGQLAVVFFVRVKTVRFIVLWYLLSLVPVLGIIPVAVPALAADRYAYIASVPFALAPALILWNVRAALLKRGALGIATALVAAGVVYTGALGAGTWSRNRVWRSSRTLWRDCLSKNPGNVTALVNLGEVYAGEADYASAERLYARAVEADRFFLLAQYNLGVIYEKTDAPYMAKRFFTDVLWQPSSMTERLTRRYRGLAAFHLGAIYYGEGKYGSAAKYARIAVGGLVPPEHASLLLDGAADEAALARRIAEVEMGDWDEVVKAVRLFGDAQEAVRESTRLADALIEEGDRAMLSDAEAARRHYSRAAEAAPDYSAPRVRLGRLHLMRGGWEEAYEEFAAASLRGAEGARFEHDFGMAALVTGRYETAEKRLVRALALDPAMREAQTKLALAKSYLGKTAEALAMVRAALEADPLDPEALKILEMITASGDTGKTDAQGRP